MQSACRWHCSGFDIGALVRHGNVSDNALVDQLCNGRRVGLGQQGVGPCAWRVGMRPIAALIQQLRQRAPGGTSYPPWLLYGGAGARAFCSNQPIHAASKVRIHETVLLQDLYDYWLAPVVCGEATR